MIFCKVYNYWNKHGEGLFFISLEYGEEVIVFEEAHSSICNLQVSSSNTSNNSSEERSDEWLDFVYLAYFQYFLQFCQKESFLYAISKWPVF